MPNKTPLLQRFLKHVNKEGPVWNGTPCWLWVGYINKNGQATFTLNEGHKVMARRVAYELFIGPILEGFCIHHKCPNRACVNPEHLEVVSRQQHGKLRPLEKRINQNSNKVRCKRGHEFTEENTQYIKGGRRCRTCYREYKREYIRERNRKRCEALGIEYGTRLKDERGRWVYKHGGTIYGKSTS